jgi:hypothetical protein
MANSGTNGKGDSRFSLAIHDLRVSGTDAEARLRGLQAAFGLPLTVHMVFDAPLSSRPSLEEFLREGMERNRLELVFHGLSHACPPHVGRSTAFYHKHQAEYLLESVALREETREVWEGLMARFHMPLGICPPCWLATSANWSFLASLEPAYLESLWRVWTPARTVPSPVVSLGSAKPMELALLRPMGSVLRRLARIPGLERLRIAIHTCDLDTPRSMAYFQRTVSVLLSRGGVPVLQRQLL